MSVTITITDPTEEEARRVADYLMELGGFGIFNLSEEDRAEVEALWEEDSYSGLESNGWSNSETEAWLFGPLEIIKES